MQLNVGKAAPKSFYHESIRDFIFENNFHLVFLFEPQFLEASTNYKYRYLSGFRGSHTQYVSAYWNEDLPASAMDLSELECSQYFTCILLGSVLFVAVYFHHEVDPDLILTHLYEYISTVPSFSSIILVADTNASHHSWDFLRTELDPEDPGIAVLDTIPKRLEAVLYTLF